MPEFLNFPDQYAIPEPRFHRKPLPTADDIAEIKQKLEDLQRQIDELKGDDDA